MVTLTKDQEFFIPCEYLVKKGGNYQDSELVEVYKKGDSKKDANCAFQATFIATGKHVGEP